MRTALLLALALLVAACQPAVEPEAIEAMPRGNFTADSYNVLIYGNSDDFLAEPLEPGSYPGVILIHEWWGLNENIRQTAERIASHGYRVVAVDLYSGRVAANATEARELVGAVDSNESIAHLAAAADYLRSRGSENVASWGFCFGGGQVASLAVSDASIDASVIYYGDLTAPLANPERVDAPVLLIYGTLDNSTTAASAQNLAMELEGQVPVEVRIYEGVGHAFANPSNAQHDVNKTRDAWDSTIRFLESNLKQ